jgi:hypothetical protein
MNNLKRIMIFGLIVALPFLTGASDERDTKQTKGAANISDKKTQTDQKVKQAATDSVVKTSMDRPLYKPPLRGAPSGRVGGGTRGITERESFFLQVLAPDHVGLTIQDQPRLYWYISKPVPYSIEFTIVERKAEKPLFEKIIKDLNTGGIQVISLANYGVHLQKYVRYKWFVTIVTDTERRSKDILAGGIITRVDVPPSLSAKLQEASSSVPNIYAEEGFWYDALEAISKMIDASPNNVELRKQRSSLLEQVGLTEAADFENRQ